MKQFRIAFIVSLTAFSGATLAATDGALGQTSSGTSVVTVDKQDAVQISGIDDIGFGTLGYIATDTTVSSALCVYSSTGSFNVTVSSAGAAYTLLSGADTIAYTVAFGPTGAPIAVTHATPSAAVLTSAVDATCTGGDNMTLDITIATTAMNPAPAGSYTDTLTLAIAPE